MSVENVEVVRRGVEAWNRGGIDQILPMFHPNVRAYPFPEWIGPKVYSGHEGFRRLSEEWTENFDEYKWDVERLLDAGDKVVALIYHRGRIKDTDMPISQPIGVVWSQFRDGLVGEGRFFLTWAEALEAAGLSD